MQIRARTQSVRPHGALHDRRVGTPSANEDARREMTSVLLRPWRDDDHEALQRLRRTLEQRGRGVWAADADGEFAGVVGLNRRRRTRTARALIRRAVNAMIPAFDVPPCTS